MFERLISYRRYAVHWSLLGLIFLIVITVVCAGILSNFKLFAFPFGTFVIGLVVPVTFIAIAFCTPLSFDDELDEG